MSGLDATTLVLLLGASIVAGAVNAVAGGGTFFTFPMLIWAGLPPLVANTTNMVALTPANFAALPPLRPQLRALGRAIIAPVLIGVAGGMIGAILLILLGNDTFAAAVPYLMGLATLFFAGAPALRRALIRTGRATAAGAGRASLALLFVFSIYGGYFGAGLGQITLAALIVAGFEDLHHANALKNAVTGMVSLVAVAIFGLTGNVLWAVALLMMVGSTAGGYVGGALSKNIPALWLRWFIIGFGIFLTTMYFLRGV